MSYTELFKFKKNGDAEDLGEVHNAWRGAMAVWKIMEDRYLPPYMPEWARGDTSKTYSRTSGFGEDNPLKEVWALGTREDVSEVDKIAMGTTYDNVIVSRENIQKVIDSFNAFEGETSLPEQAKLLEEALKDEDMIAVSWNQTSVCGDNWTNIGGYNEEEDEYTPYNILKQDEHWELFQEDEEEVDEQN
jgi:hypothetical protein